MNVNASSITYIKSRTREDVDIPCETLQELTILGHLMGLLEGSNAQVFVYDGKNVLCFERFGQVISSS